MKARKILSTLSAAAICASCIGAMTVTASAATDLIYAGSTGDAMTNYSVSGVTGAINASGSPKAHQTDSTVSYKYSSSDETIISLFDTDRNGYVDSTYASVYIDYIGKTNGIPYIENVNLSAGAYTLYYVGGNKNSTDIVLNFDSSYTATPIVNVKTPTDSPDATYGLRIIPIEIYLPEAYSGSISFTEDGQDNWLPDLYSIKIVDGEEFPTQDDIITATDITRDSSRTTRNEVMTDITAGTAYTDALKAKYGENMANIGTTELTYTDTTDYYYLNVTEAGTYTLDVLGTTTRSTAFTFTNTSDSSTASATTGTYTSVGTYTNSSSTSGTIYLHKTGEVALSAGVYKVELSKTDSYYTNLVAIGMNKAEEETADAEITVEKEGTYTDDGSDYAVAFIGTVKPNGNTVNGLTWTATAGEASNTAKIETTLSGDATYTYGLVVTLTSDAAKTAGVDSVSATLAETAAQ